MMMSAIVGQGLGLLYGRSPAVNTDLNFSFNTSTYNEWMCIICNIKEMVQVFPGKEI